MKYRREIDGMRAVAVLAVILFHAGFPAFSGGFVGVDVFFVISGYLITSIILIERQKGAFSLRHFYERRARRILPALFVMVFATVPFAWFWLMPGDLVDYAHSLMSVSTFSSNLLFFHETGYFNTEAELTPLIHTWSLAVEEQFYIVFPVFLLIIFRTRKRFITGIVALTGLCSFVYAHWASYNNPNGAFFLLTARGWELMIGALIAFYHVSSEKQGTVTATKAVLYELLCFLGLAFISYAVFSFSGTTPFPGFYALFPTLGAAIIILYASPKTIIGRILGSRILVTIGLISYSAYLWHYPMFVFMRHRKIVEPDKIYFIIMSAAALLIAYAVWKFVEQPFRKKHIVGTSFVWKFSATGAVIIFSFGLTGHVLNGIDTRFPTDFKKVGRVIDEVNPKREICHNPDLTEGIPEKKCLYDSRFDTGVLLWGDSAADALAPALGETLAQHQMALLQLTHNGCVPVPGLVRMYGAQRMSCVEFNNTVMNFIQDDDRYDYVILYARWTLNYHGNRFDNKEGGLEYGPYSAVQPVHESYVNESERKKLVAEYYQKLITELLSLGKKIVLVYPTPEAGWNVPRHLMKTWAYEGSLSPAMSSTSYEVFKNRNKEIYDILDGVENHRNLFRVVPERLFCNTRVKGRCITHIHGNPLYKDDDHLSEAGARMLAGEIIKSMQ